MTLASNYWQRWASGYKICCFHRASMINTPKYKNVSVTVAERNNSHNTHNKIWYAPSGFNFRFKLYRNKFCSKFWHHHLVLLSQLVPTRKQQPQERIEDCLYAGQYKVPTWRRPVPWIQQSEKQTYKVPRVPSNLCKALMLLPWS